MLFLGGCQLPASRGDFLTTGVPDGAGNTLGPDPSDEFVLHRLR
jgi:hypothetical protein